MTFTARLLTVVAAALPISAQTSSGNITGRLHDPSAAAIPAAEVTAKNADTGLELRAESNSEGLYTFSLLPPGSYQVTARASGR